MYKLEFVSRLYGHTSWLEDGVTLHLLCLNLTTTDNVKTFRTRSEAEHFLWHLEDECDLEHWDATVELVDHPKEPKEK